MPALLTYRGVVAPSDCDILGHMNVARYFDAASDAGFTMQANLGLTAADMTGGRRISGAVVHADSNFIQEVLAGETIHVLTDIPAIGTKSITYRHRLFRSTTDELAFVSVFKNAMLSLETRKAVPIPDDMRAAAQAYLTEARGE
ncbi:MAG: thioesterase family protein [Pseudomonadota bacterium]|nr:thioesterase family protein [Pseudomonadota bacterium]